MTRTPALLSLCAACALAGGRAAAGDAERLAAANTAALRAIRTLHCKVRVEDASARWGVTRGEYWRSGDRSRLEWVEKGDFNQAVIRDGLVRYNVKQDISGSPNMKAHAEVQRSLEGGRYFWHAAVEPFEGRVPFAFDPWFAAMCSTSDGGQSGNVTFAEFARAHAGELSRTPKPDEVEFRLQGLTATFAFDPAANGMLRKMASVSDDPKGYRSESEVTAFAERAPGVFFPDRVVVRRWSRGEPEADEVFTFAEVAVNKPIPDSTFAFRFHPGVKVTDRVEQTEYWVDAGGRPVGAKSPMAVFTPAPAGGSATEPGRETQAEPRRWGWWLLPASLVTLAAGLLVALRRRGPGGSA